MAKVAPKADDNTTGEGTHVANARGFAGSIVEVGEVVPAGIPLGSWMEPVSKKAPAQED